MTDVRPPVPVLCRDRPTIGGLVAPIVNVRLADGGVDFRATHRATWERCWRNKLCQVCGNPLTTPLVLFGGPNQLQERLFDEPGLHPACAAYAQQACPMVAGRMLTYANREQLSAGQRGKTCPDPDCDCGGWVPDDGRPHLGDPAHPWHAVWLRDYTLAVRPDGRVAGGTYTDDQLLRVRLISTPADRALEDACPSRESHQGAVGARTSTGGAP